MRPQQKAGTERDASGDGAAKQRLQKLLARAGIASRRHAEELILAGRVRINGRVVSALGVRADPIQDTIEVDGRALPQTAEPSYFALNKPAGYITTAYDPQGRPTVMALVPPVPGLFPVGRLDAESEGLLLLTTDGDWAQRVVHPRYGCSKEYLVDVPEVPSAETLERLRWPMMLAPGEPTTGAEVAVVRTDGGGTTLRVVLYEGRNRQIRRMLALVRLPVRRLVRTRVGPVRLRGLAAGEWRLLTMTEVRRLAAQGAEVRSRPRMEDTSERLSLRRSSPAATPPLMSTSRRVPVRPATVALRRRCSA